MPSEVRHLVEGGLAYPVVRFSGALDTGSAATVREALFTVLAGQPQAVVVDVAALTVDDPAATAVLTGITRDTADWPAAHLALCAPDDSAWPATGLPCWPTVPAAVAGLGRPAPELYRHLDLTPELGAARVARRLVTEACADWDLTDLAGPGCIVLTEMVNNVVAHARTPMTVLLARRAAVLSVAVRDQSPTVPRFAGPVAPTAYGGRGLLLIDSVAERWGSMEADGGKVVWALLDRVPSEPDADVSRDPSRSRTA
jgi:anti-anti-sigma regulatory factor